MEYYEYMYTSSAYEIRLEWEFVTLIFKDDSRAVWVFRKKIRKESWGIS